jgi:hypothetical protein
VQQTTELDLAVNTIRPKALAVIAPLNELPLGACPECSKGKDGDH